MHVAVWAGAASGQNSRDCAWRRCPVSEPENQRLYHWIFYFTVGMILCAWIGFRYNFVEHFCTDNAFEPYVSDPWIVMPFFSFYSSTFLRCLSLIKMPSVGRQHSFELGALLSMIFLLSVFPVLTWLSSTLTGGQAGTARVRGSERDLPSPLSRPSCVMGTQARTRRARRVWRRLRRPCKGTGSGSAGQKANR